MGASCGREGSINRESSEDRNGISSTFSSNPARLGPPSIATPPLVSPDNRAAGGDSTPLCSARRKASCTRLILYSPLNLRDVIIHDRSRHNDRCRQTSRGPSQPCQTLTASNDKIV